MTSAAFSRTRVSAADSSRKKGAEKKSEAPRSFSRAMEMLATTKYYDMLGAFAVHVRGTFPTSAAGLARAGVPADFAELIVSENMRKGALAAVAISLFIEELFELKGFSHPDILAIRRYCRRKMSAAEVEALRLRVREAIRTRWPNETRRDRKHTPWDALYRSYCPQVKPANRKRRSDALNAFG